MSDVRNHVERDPVTAARARALARVGQGMQNASLGWLAEVGADEALRPIRELHQPQWMNCLNACCSGEECKHRSRLCRGCDEYWPCATARLVYTEDELVSPWSQQGGEQ